MELVAAESRALPHMPLSYLLLDLSRSPVVDLAPLRLSMKYFAKF